jgi:hypothetical protein
VIIVHISHTIASGNCSNMNNAIAGKMISDVSGLDDVSAAVAKELNATSKGIPLHKATLHAWGKFNKNEEKQEIRTDRHDANLP